MQAVKIAIGPDNLALPLEPDGRKYIPERLVKLQLCQNTVDSILSLGSNEKSSSEIRYEDHWACSLLLMSLKGLNGSV